MARETMVCSPEAGFCQVTVKSFQDWGVEVESIVARCQEPLSIRT